MRTVSDRDLLAWLSRSLTPGRALEIADEVAASPTLQLRARELGASLAEPPRGTSTWRLPPPGMVAGRTPLRVHVESAVFGAESKTQSPGTRVSVYLDDLADAADRLVVVLLRGAGPWSVIFPQGPDDKMTLAELPTDAQGRRGLHLRAPDLPGEWRFGLALPEATRVDIQTEAAQGWAVLRAEVAAGTVPVATVSVTVA